MTESELNEHAAALEEKKRSLERSRNICFLALAFMAYNMWKAIREGTPPVWFYAAMGLILLALAAIAFFAHKGSLKASSELAELRQNKPKEESADFDV